MRETHHGEKLIMRNYILIKLKNKLISTSFYLILKNNNIFKIPLKVLSFLCGKAAVACYQKSSKLKGPDSLKTEKSRFPHPFEGPPLLYGLVERKSAGVGVDLQGLLAKAIPGSHSNTKITFLFLEKLK